MKTIKLMQPNGQEIAINSDGIECMTRDNESKVTRLTFVSGRSIWVSEDIDAIIEKIGHSAIDEVMESVRARRQIQLQRAEVSPQLDASKLDFDLRAISRRPYFNTDYKPDQKEFDEMMKEANDKQDLRSRSTIWNPKMEE